MKVSIISEKISDYITKLRIFSSSSNSYYSFEDFLSLLANKTFALYFSECIIEFSKGFPICLEIPCINSKNFSNSIFECCVIISPDLDNLDVDPVTFSKYFTGKNDIVSFFNLDKSSILISPKSDGKNYKHLYSFLVNSTKDKIAELWYLVSKEAKKLVDSGTNVWISTSGYGVGWLHIRIDQKPKYYKFYRDSNSVFEQIK